MIPDPMFSSRTDAELARLYCGMHATATELGVTHQFQQDHANRADLIRRCARLHKSIVEFQAERDLENDPALSGKKETEMSDEAQGGAEAEKTDPPKKTAKKASKKKVAKKKVAKKKAAGERKPKATGAVDVTDTMTISVKTKENPRREGTPKHERFALIMKCEGLTVAKFVAKGGVKEALRNAVREGHVALKGA